MPVWNSMLTPGRNSIELDLENIRSCPCVPTKLFVIHTLAICFLVLPLRISPGPRSVLQKKNRPCIFDRTHLRHIVVAKCSFTLPPFEAPVPRSALRPRRWSSPAPHRCLASAPLAPGVRLGAPEWRKSRKAEVVIGEGIDCIGSQRSVEYQEVMSSVVNGLEVAETF